MVDTIPEVESLQKRLSTLHKEELETLLEYLIKKGPAAKLRNRLKTPEEKEECKKAMECIGQAIRESTFNERVFDAFMKLVGKRDTKKGMVWMLCWAARDAIPMDRYVPFFTKILSEKNRRLSALKALENMAKAKVDISIAIPTIIPFLKEGRELREFSYECMVAFIDAQNGQKRARLVENELARHKFSERPIYAEIITRLKNVCKEYV